MKLSPRFSLRALAIFVTLTAFGVWWGTWPEQTAKKFHEALFDLEIDNTSRFMATAEDRQYVPFVRQQLQTLRAQPHILQLLTREYPTEMASFSEFKPVNRSWSDIVFGCGCYQFGFESRYYVSRGRVSFNLRQP